VDTDGRDDVEVTGALADSSLSSAGQVAVPVAEVNGSTRR